LETRETGCSGRSEVALSAARPLRWIALAAVAAPIFVVTLVPGPASGFEPLSAWCVVCGWRGTSDALLNVVLFVPLGFVLGSLGRRTRQALAIGLAVSLGIELAQTMIPFRFPSLGDVIWNAFGCGTGTLLYGARDAVFGPDRRMGARLTTVWAALGIVGLCLQGWLLVPSMPDRRQWVGWMPVTPEAAGYPGRLLAVSANGRGIASPTSDFPSAIEPGDPRLTAFGSGEIELVILADTLPRWLMPLFSLEDEDGRETFFVGVDGADLVVRYRTRGMVARLDRPYPRWRDGAAWTAGDTVRLHLGLGRRLTAGTREGARPVEAGPARLAVPAGRGWGFLMFPSVVAKVAGGGADLVWMLLLAIPLGYWGPLRRALAAGAGWAIVLLGAPVAFPLLAASPWGVAGVPAGVLLGGFVRYIRDDPLPFMFWRPLDISLDDLTGPEPAGASRSDAGGRSA